MEAKAKDTSNVTIQPLELPMLSPITLSPTGPTPSSSRASLGGGASNTKATETATNLDGSASREPKPGRKPNAPTVRARAKGLLRTVAIRSRGPSPPRIQRIRPLLPRVQEAPLRAVDWLVSFVAGWLGAGHSGPGSTEGGEGEHGEARSSWRRKRRRQLAAVLLLALFLVAWTVAFALPLVMNTGNSGPTAIIDGQRTPVQVLRCIDTFWVRDNLCGVDGLDCGPFEGGAFAFRCPANCAGVQVLNPRWVGSEMVLYRSLVVGGGEGGDGNGTADLGGLTSGFYRGDSFICAAAIHAGLVSDHAGGCGVVARTGRRTAFPPSTRAGIASVGFDSYFPLSFAFLSSDAAAVECGAVHDPRQTLLAVDIIFTSVLALATASPALFFFLTFVDVFFHVALVSEPPPVNAGPATLLPALFEVCVGRLLPALFIAVAMYKFAVRKTLGGFRAQIEKMVLWLGACWVGALTNYTLDFIPLQRLTGHDLEQQPGAKVALSFLVVIIFVLACLQAYFFWLEARLRRYLALYGLFILAILVSLALPGLNLRIHHYILALLLLPGTSLQTRPSLLLQGVLVGLFINGVARWGFAPVLQTPESLMGDALIGSVRPIVADPIISLAADAATVASNITFAWTAPPPDAAAALGITGISVLVNDVERYRRFFPRPSDWNTTFTWSRTEPLNEYFRFAYLAGASSLDYTNPGTWSANGTWSTLEPS